MPRFYDYVNTMPNSSIPFLLDFCESTLLTQFNGILNVDGQLLDLVFANVDTTVDVAKNDHPLLPEDQYHPALCITFDAMDTLGQPFSL